MMSLFEWLDASPVRYWIVAWSCFAALIAATLASREGEASEAGGSASARWHRRFAHPAVFATLVFLTLAAFRWPVWFAPVDANPDEDQIIASAITLRQFPVFWKYADTGTSGPLNAYLLVAANWLGVPFTYVGARSIATCLQALSLLGAWMLLRQLVPERPSRLALLPGLCFWAFTSFHDFMQYSTEHLSIVLVTGAALAGTYALRKNPAKTHRTTALLVCGLLNGMVPFGKLQLAPLALLVVLCVAAVTWRQECKITRKLLREWLALGIGGLAFPVIVAVCIEIYGLWGQFNLSYLQANLGYMQDGDFNFGDQPGRSLAFLFGAPGTGLLIGGCLATALLFTWPTWTVSNKSIRAWSAVTWLGLGVAVFCVIRPGRELAHYIQIMVVPCCILAGVHLDAALNTACSTGLTRWRGRGIIVMIFLSVTVLLPILFRAKQGHIYIGRLAEFSSQLISPESAYLIEHKQPGDTLTVWGWVPRLYVETQMPHGTRESITARQLSESPYRYIFRERFMRDMARRAPTWFVDSVGPASFGFQDRTVSAHETFPELDALITADYEYLTEINDVRIFRHRKAPPLQWIAH